MKKCSNQPPDYKFLEFEENPARKNIYDLQTTSTTFKKFRYFRLEQPKQPYLLRMNVKYVCESWQNNYKTLHTGLIPTGIKGFYFGDHIEVCKDKKKSSLIIFRLNPENNIIQLYYFNHFNKRSVIMKLEFCRNFIIKKGLVTTPAPNVQIHTLTDKC